MKVHPKAQYKINYKSCTQDSQHIEEKMNFVCLNQECSLQSLICSLCREQQHKGHITKPLKFYIEDLKKMYENEKKDFSGELQKLEQSRATFLIQLRLSMEKIVEEFRKLQKDVIEKYEKLHEQILQQQSRQNNFSEFYQSLSQDNDKHESLIQNYLPQQKTQYLTNIELIQNLRKKLSFFFDDVKTVLLSPNKKEIEKKKVEIIFKLPPTIFKIDNMLTQTNFNSQQTLCVIPLDIVKTFQNLKFKIKINKCKLKQSGKIHFGAINKKLFQIEKHKNIVNNSANLFGKIFYCENNGTVFGHTTSLLKVFNQQSVLQIIMNHNLLKIGSGKGFAEFKLPQDEEHYLFFNLIGESSIQFIDLPK